MGVHTGDSIVVAPIQTLPDPVVQRLRRCALKIVRALKLEGGCNVQLAVAPDGSDYRVIEVNPRVSRSSALASKATGYPIARIAAQIALGRRLHELPNPATGGNSAAFEPAVDYVVVKLPRWPFDKFPTADRSLGVQMKATGEAMAIDREFGPALLKAVRSLEPRGRGWLWEDPAWELADRPPGRPPGLPGAIGHASVADGRPPPPRLGRCGRHRGRHRHRPVVHRSARGGRRGRAADRRGAAARGQASGLRRRGDRIDLRRAGGGGPARPRARRHRSLLSPGRHLRGRVPGRDAVLLLLVRRSRGAAAGRAAQRDRRRIRTDPHRPGDRVRLLLGARRVGDPRDGPRRGRHQQQPRDGLDRLRRLHPPLLRAARHRVGARRHRPRAGPDRDAARRRPHVRRTDGDRPREGPRLRRRPDRRADRRGDRDHRGSRAVRASARRSSTSTGRAGGSRDRRPSCGARSRRSAGCRSSSVRPG